MAVTAAPALTPRTSRAAAAGGEHRDEREEYVKGELEWKLAHRDVRAARARDKSWMEIAQTSSNIGSKSGAIPSTKEDGGEGSGDGPGSPWGPAVS